MNESELYKCKQEGITVWVNRRGYDEIYSGIIVDSYGNPRTLGRLYDIKLDINEFIVEELHSYEIYPSKMACLLQQYEQAEKDIRRSKELGIYRYDSDNVRLSEILKSIEEEGKKNE